MANSVFSKLVKSLWILAAFIPVLNGLGFAYIGAKEFKREWFIEGLIYELPWFLAFLFINASAVMGFFIIVGLLGVLLSIIRTFYVYSKNKDILIGDDPESQVVLEKSISSFWVIFSCIIFINGLGLLYVGIKRKVNRWIIEGLLFELFWVLVFLFGGLSQSLSLFLVSLGMIGVILSIMITFVVYFEEEKMDVIGFNVNPAVSETAAQSIGHVDTTSISSSNENVLSSSSNETLPELKDYKDQILELKDTFKSKEADFDKVLNKRFTKGELTYGRFKTVVNDCHDLFNSQADSALTIINLAPNYTDRVDESIKGKIDLLKSLIGEMDNLIEEMILNDGLPEKSDEEIDHLFSNMHELIDSVDDYN